MYSIGEFSKITGLSVKTLRFYHEQGLLAPTAVDDQTGYRYYAPALIERARIISRLRELEVPLAEIAALLAAGDDESDLLGFLERHRQAIEQQQSHLRAIRRSLDAIITQEREVLRAMNAANFEIQEKSIQPLLIAGIRMRGKYSECGTAFGRLGSACRSAICGKPMMLIYDHEFRENDADFEPCMPVRKQISPPGIDVRQLPSVRVVSLVHLGPYDELGRSYAKVFDYLHNQGYEAVAPCREVYLKGPGMIFRGNPRKYLTEIQVPFERRSPPPD